MSSHTGGSKRPRIAGAAARRRREANVDSEASAATETDAAAADAETPAPVAPDTAASNEKSVGVPDEMAAAAPEKEPEAPEPEAERPTGPRSPMLPPDAWWWLGAVCVITVCALVFAGVVSVRYLGDRTDDAASAQDREDATSAAATAAQEILGYDYQDLDADRTAAEKLMTDDFSTEYEKLYSGAFCDVVPEQNCTETGTYPEVIQDRKQSVDASVIDAGALECGDECSSTKTRVLLFVDQTTTTGDQTLAPAGSSAVFTMVKTDGDWLVDYIE